MYCRASKPLYIVDDTLTNVKRATSSTPPKQSNNVVLGIILGVIALIATAIVSLLLWRLSRQTRKERRQAQQIDLLGPDPFILPGSGEPSEKDAEQGLEEGRLSDEKPLPKSPDRTSMLSFSTRAEWSPESRRSVGPSNMQFPVPRPNVPIIRSPLPAVAREALMSNASIARSNSLARPSMSTFPPRSQSISSSMATSHIPSQSISSSTPYHSRTNTISSVGHNVSHSRSISSSNGPTNSSESVTSNTVRGGFTVANLSERNGPRFEKPQLIHNELPPDYTVDTRRGRIAPFPSKGCRKPRPASILTPVREYATDPGPSTAPVYPSEKRGYLDDSPLTPGTSYTVQLPVPCSAKSSSSFGAQQRTRSPLTITASRPVSNVIVGEVGAVHRPDGTQGKARMITMSVLVEESESDGASSNGDPYAQNRELRESLSGSDVLGQVVDSYVREGDLPPYTPRNEAFR